MKLFLQYLQHNIMYWTCKFYFFPCASNESNFMTQYQTIIFTIFKEDEAIHIRLQTYKAIKITSNLIVDKVPKYDHMHFERKFPDCT